jgi:hypothetical protein
MHETVEQHLKTYGLTIADALTEMGFDAKMQSEDGFVWASLRINGGEVTMTYHMVVTAIETARRVIEAAPIMSDEQEKLVAREIVLGMIKL